MTRLSNPSARLPSHAKVSGGPPFSVSVMGSVTHPQTSPTRSLGSESGEHGVVHVNATGGTAVGVAVGLGVGVADGTAVGVAVGVAVGDGSVGVS